ncbi:MAG: hypothetical protein GY924_24855, partial [Planctomycetaceae bacterium]|nr:hypothetical protein [Planctomycetaceae bacterium]
AALFAPHSNEERLDVACTTSFAVLWLAPRLRRFCQANAQASVRILSTLWPDDYLTEKTDIQIRFGSQTLIDDASALLIKDEIVPVCAPGHVDKMGHVDDLWQLPLIETVGAQYSWDRWAQQFGAQSPPVPGLVVDSLILAKTLAEVGYGVALASRLICHDSIQEGKLVVPFDRPVSTNDCFFISASEKAWRKSAARSFHDWLQIEIEASGRT